ncbi:MAG TPA: STAS domain-containing protein [Terriglobales bacterium]|nr:STAS domain-containing protein [Terriglobales bacterium]
MLITLDEKQLVPDLQEMCQKLDTSGTELVVDFSAVRRIDSNAVRVIEELAQKAENKAAKVVLRGVDVDIYKVLKLVKLASRFSFVA